MLRTPRWLCGCMVAAAMLAGVQDALANGRELISNVGMEPPYEDGLPKGWVRNCWGENDVVLAEEKEQAHNGRAALKIECRSLKTGAAQFFHPLSVRAGMHYTVSLWVKATTEVGEVGVCLRLQPAPYTKYGRWRIIPTAEWKRYVFNDVSLEGEQNAGLYIHFVPPTGKGTVWVDDVSVIESELPPGDKREIPQRTGNVVPNASFELDPGRNWRFFASKAEADQSTKRHGTRCMRVDFEGRFKAASQVFEFCGCKEPLILSLWARAEGAVTEVSVELKAATVVPGSKPLARLRFKPDGTWQRYSTKVNIPIAKGGGVFLRMSATAESPITLYLDALSLASESEEEGFRCATDLEASIASDAFAHIYDAGSAARFRVMAFNDSDEARRVGLHCVVLDVDELPVKEQLIKLALGPGSVAAREIEFRDLPTGAYRAELRAGEEVLSAVCFSVLPPARRVSPDVSSAGAHFRLDENHMKVAQRLGITWTRIHDCSSITHWRTVQPEPDKWVWHDEDVAVARRHGVRILGEFMRTATWAGKDTSGISPPKSLDAFETYVTRTVDHYKDDIKYWELWNEPYLKGFWKGTPQEFTRMCNVAAPAAKRADPDCVILGPCTHWSMILWTPEVLKAGVMQGVDIFSYHGYSGYGTTQYGFIRSWAAHGRDKPLPIWNTETGLSSGTFYRNVRCMYVDSYVKWLKALPPKESAARQVQLYLLALGGGAEKYFQYWTVHEDSLLPRLSAMSLFEYDFSLRPMGASYAIAINRVDGRQAVSYLAGGEGVIGCLFRDDRRSTLCLWTIRLDLETQLTPVNAPEFSAADMMGRELPLDAEGRVPISFSPVYLETDRESEGALLRAFGLVQTESAVTGKHE